MTGSTAAATGSAVSEAVGVGVGDAVADASYSCCHSSLSECGIGGALRAVDHVADPQLPADEEQGHDARGEEQLAEHADDGGSAARARRAGRRSRSPGAASPALEASPSGVGLAASSTGGF